VIKPQKHLPVSTQQKKERRKKYPSDISKNGWKKLKAYLPKSKSADGKAGRKAVNLREVINAIGAFILRCT
jgi:hypothetical protein